MNIQIYHNPRCGKSRDALQYLKAKGIEPQVILYLQNPPSFDELKELVHKLNINPKELIRKKENIFIAKYNSLSLSDDEWIKVMTEHPILIERPIIVSDYKAVIGRPKERIEEVMNH
jgi:arsenate reductase